MKCMSHLLRCVFSISVLALSCSVYGSAYPWKLEVDATNIINSEKYEFYFPINLPNGAELHVIRRDNAKTYIKIFDENRRQMNLRSYDFHCGSYIGDFQFVLLSFISINDLINKIFYSEHFKAKETVSKKEEDPFEIHHF